MCRSMADIHSVTAENRRGKKEEEEEEEDELLCTCITSFVVCHQQ